MSNPIVNFVLRNQVLTAILFLGLLVFLYEIRAILLIVFASFIIMSSLYPLVDFLRKYRIPVVISAAVAYVVLVGLIVLLIIPILPLFLSQVQELLNTLPKYLSNLSTSLGFEISKEEISSTVIQSIGSIGQRALAATGQVFGGIFSIITMIIISFYMLLDRERLEKSLSNLFPARYSNKASKTISQIEEKLGYWLRGQVVLSFSVGLLTWVALTLLGIPFALPLAILAGFLEIVPTLGPILAAIPAIIVGLSISPFAVGSIIVAYILIQLAENNLLVPLIMQKAVGLNPIIVILVILIGASLFGLIGALLAVPFVSALILVLKAFNAKQ
jgi:predicted PurR-regulated permease PerM